MPHRHPPAQFALWTDQDLRRVVKNAAKHDPSFVAAAKTELERRITDARKHVRAVHFVRRLASVNGGAA